MRAAIASFEVMYERAMPPMGLVGTGLEFIDIREDEVPMLLLLVLPYGR